MINRDSPKSRVPKDYSWIMFQTSKDRKLCFYILSACAEEFLLSLYFLITQKGLKESFFPLINTEWKSLLKSEVFKLCADKNSHYGRNSSIKIIIITNSRLVITHSIVRYLL